MICSTRNVNGKQEDAIYDGIPSFVTTSRGSERIDWRVQNSARYLAETLSFAGCQIVVTHPKLPGIGPVNLLSCYLVHPHPCLACKNAHPKAKPEARAPVGTSCPCPRSSAPPVDEHASTACPPRSTALRLPVSAQVDCRPASNCPCPPRATALRLPVSAPGPDCPLTARVRPGRLPSD